MSIAPLGCVALALKILNKPEFFLRQQVQRISWTFVAHGISDDLANQRSLLFDRPLTKSKVLRDLFSFESLCIEDYDSAKRVVTESIEQAHRAFHVRCNIVRFQGSAIGVFVD